MRQVYAFRLDEHDAMYKRLKQMSRTAKDLYNQALWEVNSHYRKCGQSLSYCQLDKVMKAKENLEHQVNYRLLPAKVAQQVLRLLEQNVKAFFKALADFRLHPEKYQAAPRFPHFLPQDGHLVLIFTNQQAAMRDSGEIKLSKDMAISMPEKEFAKYRTFFIKAVAKKVVPLFAQIRVVPKFNAAFFHVEIVYDRPASPVTDSKRVAAIDMGVNNLAALVDCAMDEENRQPLLINGKPLKSINQYYNKLRAQMQQRLAESGKKHSKQLCTITDIRNQKIEDYLHKASRFIIRYCLQQQIGHLVIGYNPEWKQAVHLGKRNNQNFVQVPFYRFIQMLCYKAQLAGIEVSTQEESYTSKCSALDVEQIAKHEDHAYAGKRIHRGLFASALGLLINADINGALNILRKAIGDAFLEPFRKKVARLIPSSGYLCYPLKVCF
jgi:putative transposase